MDKKTKDSNEINGKNSAPIIQESFTIRIGEIKFIGIKKSSDPKFNSNRAIE